MIRVKSMHDPADHTAGVGCPNCKESEWWGADEPRKRFEFMEIVDEGTMFLHDKDKNGVSTNQCHFCKETFEVEWDYDNIVTE